MSDKDFKLKVERKRRDMPRNELKWDLYNESILHHFSICQLSDRQTVSLGSTVLPASLWNCLSTVHPCCKVHGFVHRKLTLQAGFPCISRHLLLEFPSCSTKAWPYTVETAYKVTGYKIKLSDEPAEYAENCRKNANMRHCRVHPTKITYKVDKLRPQYTHLK